MVIIVVLSKPTTVHGEIVKMDLVNGNRKTVTNYFLKRGYLEPIIDPNQLSEWEISLTVVLIVRGSWIGEWKSRD